MVEVFVTDDGTRSGAAAEDVVRGGDGFLRVAGREEDWDQFKVLSEDDMRDDAGDVAGVRDGQVAACGQDGQFKDGLVVGDGAGNGVAVGR